MTVHTAYQGIEVLATEPEVKSRHPRWGYDKKRLATLQGASLLLLADGTELVVCDDCGFNGITGNNPYVKPEGEIKEAIYQADSVMAHKSGTHWLTKPRTPMYSEEMIKVAIKVYLKWKGTGVRNWATAAANELTASGFSPYRSDTWTSGALSRLAIHYMKHPKFKNIKAGPVTDSDREALASMVRLAAEEAGKGGRQVLASSVRITEPKKKSHTPIDFGKIISDQEATKSENAKDNDDEVDAEVIKDSPNPTLNFAGNSPDKLPIRKLDVGASATASRPVVVSAPVVVAADQDFEFVTELGDADATLLFKYKGKLMAGKPVKGIEF